MTTLRPAWAQGIVRTAHGATTAVDWRFLVADRFTLADIALFAYTHVAPEGGFSLDGYPAIRAWIGKVQAERGHAPITQA